MKLFGSDVGVDLGTASLRMSLRGKGVVLRAPTGRPAPRAAASGASMR